MGVKLHPLLLSAAALLLGSCSAQKIAPGIEPVPQTGFFARREQVRLPAEKADVAVIFVAGFAEQVMTHTRELYQTMPLLPLEGRQLRAYYTWDGGRGCLFAHSTRLLQDDLRAFLRVNPQADIVFVGHSYGGSAVMDALRRLGKGVPRRHTIVLTLDPVSLRKRSHPQERAEGVDYWINVYCEPYRHGKDIVASIAGPWRECRQADVNLRFSGKERDSRGHRYQHSRPGALLLERPSGCSLSAYEHLLLVCKAFKNNPKQP